MKKRFTLFVSPAHYIDTIVIFALLVFLLIGIILFAICTHDWEAFYIPISCWFVFLTAAVLSFLLSKKGLVKVYLYEDKIQSRLLKKICCELSLKDVHYVRFVQSWNYGADTTPIYMVLSKEKIEDLKNLALTYDLKRQIVLRVTSKNWGVMKEYWQATSLNCFDYSFSTFKQIVIEQKKVLYSRTGDGSMCETE